MRSYRHCLLDRLFRSAASRLPLSHKRMISLSWAGALTKSSSSSSSSHYFGYYNGVGIDNTVDQDELVDNFGKCFSILCNREGLVLDGFLAIREISLRGLDTTAHSDCSQLGWQSTLALPSQWLGCNTVDLNRFLKVISRRLKTCDSDWPGLVLRLWQLPRGIGWKLKNAINVHAR